jgi:hypothetical protein
MPRPGPTSSRPRWTAAQWSYLALALNGGCLVVLFANLLTGNTWWQGAVSIAIGLLVLGGLSAFNARRLRARERRDL